MFEQYINPIMNPLLSLNPFLLVLIVSFGVTLFTTLIYWLVTDQKKMKRHKERMKELNKEMKKHKQNPKKLQTLQAELLQLNGEYMKHSFKPTLFTLLPLLIIFGWMSSNLSYEIINPGDNFTTTVVFDKVAFGNITIETPPQIKVYGETTKQVSPEIAWLLSANESGNYDIIYKYNGKTYSLNVIIGNRFKTQPLKKLNDDMIKELKIDTKKLIVLDLGFWKMGWLITYLLFSVLFSMSLRKIFKIY